MTEAPQWHDTEINGRKASICQIGEARLYVCERHGAIEAWRDHLKVGNFATMDDAKAAACGMRPKHPLQPSARAYVTKNPPPVADLSVPPTSITVAKAVEAKPVRPAIALEGRCKCGTRLGRSGKCPALCEPLPKPLPKYNGPTVVGRTHLGKLGAPVYQAGPDWIGGADV